MKALALLLAVSLCANLALLVLGRVSPPVASDNGSAARSDERERVDFARSSTASPPSVGPASVPGNAWSDLNADDLETLVARLRAAGFPPRVLRDVVFALVSQRFESREREVYDNTGDTPYWKMPRDRWNDPELVAKRTALEREQRELFKKLLGVDYELADEDALIMQRRRFGDLPVEKIAQLQKLQTDHYAAMNGIHQFGRALTDADREKIFRLQADLRASIAKALTPREFEEFERRNSDTATILRNQLQAFNATENEYLAIYQLRRPIDEQYSYSRGELSPEQQAARQRAEEQLKPQLKALLGPERYADYEQSTSGGHMQLNRIVTRLGLPLASARAVVEVQREFTDRASTLRSDTALTSENRDAQLTALVAEAEKKIAGTLGAPGLDAYKQYSGQWLRTLRPAPKP